MDASALNLPPLKLNRSTALHPPTPYSLHPTQVPLYPLVAPSVLVESFERGALVSEYVARGAGAPHNSALARVGARAMLHMLIVDNLVGVGGSERLNGNILY